MSTIPLPRTPRIAPLTRDEADEHQRQLIERAAPDGTPLLNVTGTMLRHPRLARHWLPFAGAVLRRGALPDRARELLVLRTAHRCRAPYERHHHLRLAREAGIGDDEIARILDDALPGPWEDLDAALLRAADELHDEASISDETWSVLADHCSVEQLIEVPLVVGQYHLVAFVLNAVGVQLETEAPS